MDCDEALVINSAIPSAVTVATYSTTATTLTYVSGWTEVFSIVG
jgi:hypothetical protein